MPDAASRSKTTGTVPVSIFRLPIRRTARWVASRPTSAGFASMSTKRPPDQKKPLRFFPPSSSATTCTTRYWLVPALRPKNPPVVANTECPTERDTEAPSEEVMRLSALNAAFSACVAIFRARAASMRSERGSNSSRSLVRLTRSDSSGGAASSSGSLISAISTVRSRNASSDSGSRSVVPEVAMRPSTLTRTERPLLRASLISSGSDMRTETSSRSPSLA